MESMSAFGRPGRIVTLSLMRLRARCPRTLRPNNIELYDRLRPAVRLFVFGVCDWRVAAGILAAWESKMNTCVGIAHAARCSVERRRNE